MVDSIEGYYLSGSQIIQLRQGIEHTTYEYEQLLLDEVKSAGPWDVTWSESHNRADGARNSGPVTEEEALEIARTSVELERDGDILVEVTA